MILFETYDKFGAYDGDSIFITDTYICVKAWNLGFGIKLDLSALVWKRIFAGNTLDATLHTMVPIQQGPGLTVS